jgi:hypothetical protein
MAGDNGPVWEKRVGWGNGLAGEMGFGGHPGPLRHDK